MFTGVALRACKCGIQCRATIAEEMGVEKKFSVHVRKRVKNYEILGAQDVEIL